MQQEPGAIFEATYECGVSGLAGTMAVMINDNQNVVLFGPTTLGIIELTDDMAQPTGTYRGMLTAPGAEGQYSIIWSNDGTFNPNAGIGEEDLIVATESLDLPSLGPGVADSVLCNAWATSESVLDCCTTTNIGSDVTLLDNAIIAASELLYIASGKQWAGVCEITVRPCTNDCMCGVQVLSRGHLVGWDGSCWNGTDCGCRPISKVLLAGHVREIVEVLIDGDVVDPSTYFVRRNRELIRKDGARWPACQSEDVDDDAPGAFAVTYTYGKAPPVAGQLAAAALACEIVKSCRNDETCALPTGVIRVVRQNISIERSFFVRNDAGVWVTGIGEVDYFLNTLNPNGIPRRATILSPAKSARFARRSPA